MKITLLLTLFNFLFTYSIFSNNNFVSTKSTLNNRNTFLKNKDSLLTSASKKQIKTLKDKDSILKKEPKNTFFSKYRTFPKLDGFKKEKSFSHKFKKAEPEFTPNFIAKNFPSNGKIDSLKNKAEALFKEIEDLKKFVDIITKDRLVEFPIGLKSKDSTGTNVTMAISEVKMHPKHAELKIFAKLSIPQQGVDLFFGAEGVKFSHNGAFLGDTKLVLLGDQPIPFNASSWLLTLKGDSDMKTGEFGDKSFITVNCNGIQEISLEADLRVSRNVLLPIDDKGNYVCGDSKEDQYEVDKDKKPTTDLDNKCYVGTSFSVKAKGWNDLLADINLPHFEVTGLKGWGFNIENAVLDLSDTRNSSNVKFPEVYKTMYTADTETLWRGIYSSNIQVTMPKSFTKNDGKRPTFGARDLLLDSNGVSGDFYGDNIINQGEGNANKWAFTLDSLEVKLEVNRLRGGSLSGTIKVPILDKPFSYKGYMTNREYGLEVITEEKINAPLFLAEMELHSNSSVALKVTDEGVYPSANLTGSLTLKANVGQETAEETLQSTSDGSTSNTAENSNANNNTSQKTDFNLPGIVFEELEINTEPGLPKIKAKKFEYSGSYSTFNFPAEIKDVKLLTPDPNTVGLGFDLKINFDNKGSNASSKLIVLGKVEDKDHLQTWKYDSVDLLGVTIDVDRSGVKILGSLEVMKDDPTYGNGFKGNVSVDIEKIKLKANAKAMFGNKDFRYWFVDVWTDNAKGGDSKLLIKKFIGGASYAMKKTSGNSNWAPSESVYVPDEEQGLSLKAGIEIGTKSNSFNGKAFLEMDYNRNGGLNRIGFTGEGSLMIKQSGSGGGAAEVTKGKLKKIGDKINDFLEKNKKKVKELAEGGNYLAISKDAIPKGDVASKGNVGVYVGIEKDFTTDTFHGEFEVYIDLKQIRGASDKQNSENTLAGRAVIHTSPDKWYLHVGTPETPISLAFIVGPETFTVNGYFMTGNVMPTQLKPHYRILQILGDDIMDTNRSSTELTAGRGFAFGLSFEYRKDFKASIFYAFIEAGIGFDVMHREYPGASCEGHSGTLGNNGWYSLGQVYAYLYGEFGVRVKLFGAKKSFKILEAGVAALLRGQFPNPSYFEGYVGAYYSVMGGLVSGRMRLHVEYGEKCTIQRNADDGLEVPIIADAYPMDKDKGVDVFIKPQVTFNYAINRGVTIQESEGEKSYMIELKEAKLLSDGAEIPVEINWSSNKTEATFDLKGELLPSEKEVTIVVKVVFKEFVNKTWQIVKSGGKEVNERKEFTFKTSKAPDYIPLSNIVYMYPVKDQKYFFPEEYDKGYVQLDINQDYLFDPSYNYKVQLKSAYGEITRSDLKYDAGKRRLYYDLPSTNTSSNYQFDVMVYPKTDEIPDYVAAPSEEILLDEDGNQDDTWFTDISNTSVEGSTTATATIANKGATRVIKAGESKSLLNYSFKSSEHTTFKNKMESLETINNLTQIISAEVDYLQIDQENHEPFELIDLVGNNYTLGSSLMKGRPILDDKYYKDIIKPLAYDFANGPDADGFTVSPAQIRLLGINSYYIGHLKNDPNGNYIKKRYPFVYNITSKYLKDFLATRNYLSNKFYNSTDEVFYNKYKHIIDSFFPTITFGNYKTSFSYTLPGGTHTSTYKNLRYVND